METVIVSYLDNYKQASTGGGEGLGRRNSSRRRSSGEAEEISAALGFYQKTIHTI